MSLTDDFPEGGTVLLVDGDMIAYYSCGHRTKEDAAVYAEWPMDRRIEFDNKYLKTALESFKGILTELKEAAWADDMLVAVKSPQNYRDLIYDDYKGHRNLIPEELKNKYVPIIRTLAIRNGLAVEAKGREADDMLQIWACEATAAGHNFVISSGDKDLDCIWGSHLHAKTRVARELDEAYSKRFFYEQLLKGDPVDKIPGVPSIGPKKATTWLAPFNTEEEFRREVVDLYRMAFGDDWRNQLLSNGKMLYLQKHENDWFNLQDWQIEE
jgi:5'-3' exonuclease